MRIVACSSAWWRRIRRKMDRCLFVGILFVQSFYAARGHGFGDDHEAVCVVGVGPAGDHGQAFIVWWARSTWHSRGVRRVALLFP